MASKDAVLKDLIQPVVEAMGFELWGLEYLSQGRHSLLRIYIDSDQGVSVDDCADVSRQVSSVLDVEDPIAGEYTLEISSPGLDRPLFTLEQFSHYQGNLISLRLRTPFEGRRKFKGQLTGVEGDEVLMVVDQHEYAFPIDWIEHARVIPQF